MSGDFFCFPSWHWLLAESKAGDFDFDWGVPTFLLELIPQGSWLEGPAPVTVLFGIRKEFDPVIGQVWTTGIFACLL